MIRSSGLPKQMTFPDFGVYMFGLNLLRVVEMAFVRCDFPHIVPTKGVFLITEGVFLIQALRRVSYTCALSSWSQSGQSLGRCFILIDFQPHRFDGDDDGIGCES